MGNAAAPATTKMACIRPRMMNSARARMRFILYFCRPAGSTAVAVGVGQQGQVAGALDSGSQLTLITCLGSGDPARNDLSAPGVVGLLGVAVFSSALFHVFAVN